MKFPIRAVALSIAIASTLAATAGSAFAQNAKDPIEGWNRAVFGFNEGLDRAVLKPVAEGYKAVVPELVRNGVSNVFANIGDGWSAINQLLQGKPVAAAEMTMRVATNTLFGIGGLFDVASDLGIERRTEDFGQTLGRWGLPAGPYLVLPVLGPSTLRDTAALPVDLQWSASALTDDSATGAGLTLLRIVDVRANLLSAGRLLDEIALDKYVFVRDGYLTRRQSQVYDGEPPASKDDEDEGPAPKPGTPTPAAAPASAPK